MMQEVTLTRRQAVAEQIDRNAPERLKALPQWVLWKYQHISGKDKPKKPPFQTSGQGAAVDNRHSWCSYSQALAKLEEGDRYEGLGFMLDSGIVAIDLDYCLTEVDGVRRISKTARQVFDIAHSYTEISPSGKGLHIFLRGSLPEENGKTPDGMKSAKGEMYTAKRYITITGNRVGEAADIRADQEAINRIYALLKPPRQEQTPATVARRYTALRQDAQIREKASLARNGAKFTRLYAGNTTGYRSASEAQLALIAMLIYWTNGDRGQAERLFKASDLYLSDEETRKKWDTPHRSDGATYGEMTIEKAIQTTRLL